MVLEDGVGGMMGVVERRVAEQGQLEGVEALGVYG